MAKTELKSVITCDMEGRIETISKGSEKIFGYQEDELIGKKRVSIFSPGETVLEHVPTWLKTASEEGEFHTETVFVRKDGSPIPAKIRITPTFRDGVQIGYCGITEVLEDKTPQEVAPEISFLTKMFTWLVITRAPFLTAVILPILIGGAWAGYHLPAESVSWPNFWLALVAGIALHISANVFNDYFDWTSGTDQLNNDYFLPYSGGSRSIELGLADEKLLRRFATISLLVSGAIGLYLAFTSGFGVLLFGLAGAFMAYFYTAPPLRLAARKGLGELSIGLSFGPLATAGTVYAISGSADLSSFLVGVPIGFLTILILWINQFPDEEADKLAGKTNLVVVLGKQKARWGYLLILVLSFGLLAYWALTGLLPALTLLTLLLIPLAAYSSWVVLREYAQRTLVRANVATIRLQAFFGLIMAAAIFFAG
ncbi:MAG TPA: UbiA family prenyltransferase [Anaerolineales bacterium]|jgi:1,4-dihydroxy-2-naphthoate octaprenyltransferase|nr:UbiA family prenyltransferase [Anaerolineales bacterium]